ncbi:MAG: hypothetical protein GF392_00245 [Candidatus Omnitrophica bacterium]|nr:hypothetical protein [Candidatus Omnitrophota bacterium]
MRKLITKSCVGTVFAVLIVSLLAVNAEAVLDVEGGWLPEKPEQMPTFAHSETFSTKYIWRGWNLGDEPVWQTDSSLSWYGLTLDLWTNYTLNDEKGRDVGYQEFTEIDYTVDYSFNLGEMSDMLGIDSPDLLDPLGFSLGYIYYTFPNVDWDDKYFDTHELYFGVSYDTFLQPYFIWYWDVDSGKGDSTGGGNGSYFQFGLGHTFEFEESGISASLGWSAGINNEQWTDKTGWADMVFSGDVSIPVFNYFTVTPNVAYSLILDRDTYNDASENEFYGGITIGFEY